jgi:pimeloyl-ACP methyl ester carboxylesterase
VPPPRARERLVPVPGGSLNVRMDVEVNVHVDGPADAPNVLLLHGFASSLHSFDAVAPLLAARLRVVRVDLLGHGRSTKDAPAYDSETQADMVVGVLDRLGIAPDAVVGHSFGADVAIGVAERHRDVSRVVVIGQAPDYSTARLPWGSSLMTRPVVGALLHRLAPAAAVRRLSGFAFAPGADAGSLFDHPGRLVQDFRATSPHVYRTVVVDRPRRLAERPLDERLRQLGRPALVILGARDQLYPVGPSSARYAAVPGVRVEVLAGSGHSPVLEEPAAVARLILDA